MNVSAVRDIVVILTSIISAIVIYIKILHNLLIETVKMKYRNIPGEQSIFGMIIRGVTYIFIVLYLAFIGYGFTTTPNKVNVEGDLGKRLILLLSAIILCGIIGTTVINFLIVLINFREKVRNEFKHRAKIGIKYEIINSVNIILTSAAGMFISNKIYTRLVYEVIPLFSNNKIDNYQIIFKEKMDIFFSTCAFELFLIGIFIICLRLQEAIKDINSDSSYVILVENDIIRCKCYLEYRQYYLVIENGIQNYINKSKVKEIKKIEDNKHETIIMKVFIGICEKVLYVFQYITKPTSRNKSKR